MVIGVTDMSPGISEISGEKYSEMYVISVRPCCTADGTGASSGIGKSTAIECSRLGARLFITGRNEERLLETYSLLEGRGHVYLCADLTDERQLEELVRWIDWTD